jgi:predicted DNA-binding transcriptional regulator AlpA
MNDVVTQTGYFRTFQSTKAVGISRTTLYRWKKAGLIKSHRVSNMVFFKISDVRDIIEGVGDKVGDAPTTPENKSTKADT